MATSETRDLFEASNNPRKDAFASRYTSSCNLLTDCEPKQFLGARAREGRAQHATGGMRLTFGLKLSRATRARARRCRRARHSQR